MKKYQLTNPVKNSIETQGLGSTIFNYAILLVTVALTVLTAVFKIYAFTGFGIILTVVGILFFVAVFSVEESDESLAEFLDGLE